MKGAVSIVLGIIALAVILGATYKYYKKYKASKEEDDQSNSQP